MVYLSIWMVQNMRVNEKMINSMEKALKYGRMELYLKELILMGKNKVSPKKIK